MIEASREFVCCLSDMIDTVKTFEDHFHFHNVTIVCKNHTYYVDEETYIQKVINLILHQQKHLDFNCSSNSVVQIVDRIRDPLGNSECVEKTVGLFNGYVLLLIIMLIVGLIGNSLVCFAFIKSKTLRTNVENYFVTSLAVADLLVILFQIPVKIDIALQNGNFCLSQEICRIYLTSEETFFVASITNLFILTIDRYITITRPYDYRKIISPTRSRLMITLVWGYALFWSVLTNYNTSTKSLDRFVVSNLSCNGSVQNHLFTWIELSVVFSIPCSFMLFIYIRIFRISLSHARNIDHELRRVTVTNRCSSNGGRNSISRISFLIQQSTFFNNRKFQARTTKVLVLVYGTFVVCWLPAVVALYANTISRAAGGSIGYNHKAYVVIFEVLPILNSILNPFIYGVFHRDFKSCLKKLLGISYLQYERRGSGGATVKKFAEIGEHFPRSAASRYPSVSISTARSNVDHSTTNESACQDTTLESQHQQDTETKYEVVNTVENNYPVYNIPEDFYPSEEKPESELSGADSDAEEYDENAFILTEFKLSGILGALHESGGIKSTYEDDDDHYLRNTSSQRSRLL